MWHCMCVCVCRGPPGRRGGVCLYVCVEGEGGFVYVCSCVPGLDELHSCSSWLTV